MCVVILRRRYELERRVAVESAAEKHSVERVTHPVARYLPHTGAIHDFRYVVRFLARNVYYGHIGFERKVIEIPQRHGGCLFVGDVIGGISLETDMVSKKFVHAVKRCCVRPAEERWSE